MFVENFSYCIANESSELLILGYTFKPIQNGNDLYKKLKNITHFKNALICNYYYYFVASHRLHRMSWIHFSSSFLLLFPFYLSISFKQKCKDPILTGSVENRIYRTKKITVTNCIRFYLFSMHFLECNTFINYEIVSTLLQLLQSHAQCTILLLLTVYIILQLHLTLAEDQWRKRKIDRKWISNHFQNDMI